MEEVYLKKKRLESLLISLVQCCVDVEILVMWSDNASQKEKKLSWWSYRFIGRERERERNKCV